MKNNKIKLICTNAMGIALFVALSMCLRVPVFENYYLCLGYVVMIIYCYYFGAINGTIVGVFGTILYCLLIGGLRGMPGWALGNIAIGLILGNWFKYSKKISNKIILYILTTIISIIAVFIGILGIKSIVENILYAQPFFVRVATNFSAFIADVVVILISIPLIYLLKTKKIKQFENLGRNYEK